VIGLPPVEAGGVKDTVTWLSPAAAVTIVGAPGGWPGAAVVETSVEALVAVTGAPTAMDSAITPANTPTENRRLRARTLLNRSEPMIDTPTLARADKQCSEDRRNLWWPRTVSV
jgi:hypothetical protein